MLNVYILPALSDNYVFVIRNEACNETAVVDPAEASVVLDFLQTKNWVLNYILNTHHHYDHIGGNEELKEKTGCKIFGYKNDAKRIPGLDVELDDNKIFSVCGQSARVLYIPGHTLGHIAYYFARQKLLFCGDTLFAMGCGRLFEGTAKQLYESLSKIKALPEEVKIYCAHEYTSKNARFALSVEPDNAKLQERYTKIRKLRNNDKPTIPFTLKEELYTNPFLRTESKEIRNNLHVEELSDQEVFTILRKRRDVF